MEQEEKIAPAQEPQEPVVPVPDKPNFLERFWFVFVGLAFIALLAVGGLWAINQKLITPKTISTPTPLPTPSPVVEIDTMTSALEQQGTSDEISAIEADLEETDFSTLDQELSDIEAELSTP